jgi:hypothetical protein
MLLNNIILGKIDCKKKGKNKKNKAKYLMLAFYSLNVVKNKFILA